MSESVDLAAFLATAEYAILQAPHGSDHEASEALISAGCHYAPRLLAAVQDVLDLAGKAVRAEHPTLGGMVLAAFGVELQEAISRALLGEGETT